MKKFNMNNTVKVKLTDKGKDIYYHQHDDLNKQSGGIFIKPKYPEIGEDGYFKEQLWHLMQTFGDHVGMGFDQPFSTDILIDDKDLLEII